MKKDAKMEMDTLGKILLLTAFLIIFLLIFKGCKDSYGEIGITSLKEYVCWGSNLLNAEASAMFQSTCSPIIVTKPEEGLEKKHISDLIRTAWWMYGKGKLDIITEGFITYKRAIGVSSTDQVFPVYAFHPKEDIDIFDLENWMQSHGVGDKELKFSDPRTTWNYVNKGTKLKKGICFQNSVFKHTGKLEKNKVYYVLFLDDRIYNEDRIVISTNPKLDDDDIDDDDECYDSMISSKEKEYLRIVRPNFQKYVEALDRCMKGVKEEPCFCDDGDIDLPSRIPEGFNIKIEREGIGEKKYKLSLIKSSGEEIISHEIKGSRLGIWEKRREDILSADIGPCYAGVIGREKEDGSHIPMIQVLPRKSYKLVYYPNAYYGISGASDYCCLGRQCSGSENVKLTDTDNYDLSVFYFIDVNTPSFQARPVIPRKKCSEVLKGGSEGSFLPVDDSITEKIKISNRKKAVAFLNKLGDSFKRYTSLERKLGDKCYYEGSNFYLGDELPEGYSIEIRRLSSNFYSLTLLEDGNPYDFYPEVIESKVKIGLWKERVKDARAAGESLVDAIPECDDDVFGALNEGEEIILDRRTTGTNNFYYLGYHYNCKECRTVDSLQPCGLDKGGLYITNRKDDGDYTNLFGSKCLNGDLTEETKISNRIKAVAFLNKFGDLFKKYTSLERKLGDKCYYEGSKFYLGDELPEGYSIQIRKLGPNSYSLTLLEDGNPYDFYPEVIESKVKIGLWKERVKDARAAGESLVDAIPECDDDVFGVLNEGEEIILDGTDTNFYYLGYHYNCKECRTVDSLQPCGLDKGGLYITNRDDGDYIILFDSRCLE